MRGAAVQVGGGEYPGQHYLCRQRFLRVYLAHQRHSSNVVLRLFLAGLGERVGLQCRAVFSFKALSRPASRGLAVFRFVRALLRQLDLLLSAQEVGRFGVISVVFARQRFSELGPRIPSRCCCVICRCRWLPCTIVARIY
jgi:hypothetical protein